MKHMRTHIISQYTQRPVFSAMLTERAHVSLQSPNEGVQCQCSTWYRRKPARVPCSPDESPCSSAKYHLCSRHCSCHRTIYLSLLHFMKSFFLFPVFFICLLLPPLSLFPLNRWFCQACVRLLLTHFSLTRSLMLCPSRSHLPFRTVSTLCATQVIDFPARLSVAQVETRISSNHAASLTHCSPSPWQHPVNHPTTPCPSVPDLQSYPQLKDTDRSVK